MKLHSLVCYVLLIICVPIPAIAKWHWADAAIMGTNIEVQLWSEDDALAQQAIKAVFEQMEAVNQDMSPYIASSALSRINAQAASTPVVVDKELFELLQYSARISELTHGAFDITFASLGFMYDYRAAKKPTLAEREAHLSAIDYSHVLLDAQASAVRFAHPNVKIDLGGIAKGYAVDRAIERLVALGIEHALVTAGGDTRLLGDRRGRPWMVGIRDPRNEAREVVKLPLSDTAISTSGDYERFFEVDGERHHHILSPKTGESAREVQSVTILGPRSVTNDALSTAVFVLGVRAGMDLVNRLPEQEAIIIDNQRKMHYSNGLTE